ncbi:MAG: ArnT family glycosyltransferase [Armatimonadota bacterium]
MLASLGKLSPMVQRLLLVLGCAALFFLWISYVPLTEIDEARFSEATREMVETGNYVVPTFNYQPRYQKPVLYYWIQAASIRLFGVNETAARLPSALAALLLVLLVHAFLLRRLRGGIPVEDIPARARAGGAAFLGAIALATMPLIAIWAHAAVTDMYLTLFTTASLLALLEADLTPADGRRQRRGWYVLAALAAGLAFLTKGPVGVVIPALVWIGYHVLQRNLGREARRVPWLSTIMAFLVVAAPWFIVMYLRDAAFVQHFFLKENVERFAAESMEGHGSSNRLLTTFYFFPLSALLLLFPFSAFLLRELILPFSARTALLTDAVLPRLRRFALVWVFVPIGFFSIASTKLPHYIQAIAGGAAILFALHLLGRFTPMESTAVEALDDTAKTRLVRRLRWAGGIELGILLLVGFVFVGGLFYVLAQGKAEGPSLANLPFAPGEVLPAGVLLAATGIPMLIGIVIAKILRRPGVLIGWTMTTWTLLLLVLLLTIAPPAVRSMYGLSVSVGKFLRTVPVTTPIFSYTKKTSEDLVYYARHAVTFQRMEQQEYLAAMEDEVSKKGAVVVVTDMERVKELQRSFDVTVMRQFDAVVVVRLTPGEQPPTRYPAR